MDLILMLIGLYEMSQPGVKRKRGGKYIFGAGVAIGIVGAVVAVSQSRRTVLSKDGSSAKFKQLQGAA